MGTQLYLPDYHASWRTLCKPAKGGEPAREGIAVQCGISLAVICLLLGCWWKNSDAGTGLRRLSVGSRLLIAPVIALGPICGCVLAGLIYGDTSPAVKADAATLRLAVAWGMLAVLILLAGISCLATLLAARQRGGGGGGGKAGHDPDLLTGVLLACCALLLVSGSFRVAAVYHRMLVEDDAIFYPLQVLPELLEILLLLWPKLMPRAALGRGFARWWAATHARQASSGAITDPVLPAESGSIKAFTEQKGGSGD